MSIFLQKSGNTAQSKARFSAWRHICLHIFLPCLNDSILVHWTIANVLKQSKYFPRTSLYHFWHWKGRRGLLYSYFAFTQNSGLSQKSNRHASLHGWNICWWCSAVHSFRTSRFSVITIISLPLAVSVDDRNKQTDAINAAYPFSHHHIQYNCVWRYCSWYAIAASLLQSDLGMPQKMQHYRALLPNRSIHPRKIKNPNSAASSTMQNIILTVSDFCVTIWTRNFLKIYVMRPAFCCLYR